VFIYQTENAVNSDVTIFNDSKKIVMTQEKINNDQSISIPDLENGVYFIRLSKDNSSITRKLVILKN
jgi:hypothetical protein